MKFGNWQVTDAGIEWQGDPLQKLVITINELTNKVYLDQKTYYESILLATNEEWLTQNDLYDLNYAFVYTIGKTGGQFDYEIFDETLARQYDLFEQEDEEDFE